MPASLPPFAVGLHLVLQTRQSTCSNHSHSQSALLTTTLSFPISQGRSSKAANLEVVKGCKDEAHTAVLLHQL